jgi:hypothetical protein
MCFGEGEGEKVKQSLLDGDSADGRELIGNVYEGKL